MKPYYEQDGITIFHGDCREVLPALSIPADAMVVNDPPYGINHESAYGASWQNTRIANDESTNIRDWIISALSPRPMVVFGTWKIEKPQGIRSTLIWDKGPAFGMGDLSFPWKGSFEEIYVIGDGWRGRRDEGVLRGHMVLSWESKGRSHPHEKPVSLATHFIEKHDAPLVIGSNVGDGVCIGGGEIVRTTRHRHRNRRTVLRDRRKASRAGRFIRSSNLVSDARRRRERKDADEQDNTSTTNQSSGNLSLDSRKDRERSKPARALARSQQT